ncbi:DNA (cytosine-5-)-methyltransferase [Pseudomonas tremae]|nr:DNA (cytosine-5-)-methyltransferase [Pseudomonas tremae]
MRSPSTFLKARRLLSKIGRKERLKGCRYDGEVRATCQARASKHHSPHRPSASSTREKATHRMTLQLNTTQSADQVVSLFSGAGGFSHGFSKAGLKPLFGAEIDKDACASYQNNIGSPCHQLDLSEVQPSVLKELVGGRSPFIIIGGPPCQGFSTAGPRNAQDPRNRLIFNYMAIVKELAPRWFVFENVEGLLTSGSGADLARLVTEFVSLGYSVRLQKMNLAAYGVPQTRKRVVIIGNRLGIDFEFPPEAFSYDSGKARKYSNLPMAPTLDSALAGLGDAVTDKSQYVPYASVEFLNDYDRLMREGNILSGVTQHYQSDGYSSKVHIEMLKPGQTMKDLPEELWHDSFKRRANRRVADGTPTEKRGGSPSGIKRLHGDRQALTITGAATREFIHPHMPRPLTIRECARIQTFPDCYQWAGNAASIIQQIGNAVPPLAAFSLAQHIKQIDGKFGSDLQSAIAVKSPRLLGFLLTESLGMSPALKNTQSLLANLLKDGLVQ